MAAVSLVRVTLPVSHPQEPLPNPQESIQGTPTQPAGTGHQATSHTAGRMHHHTHVSKVTHTLTHIQGTQSTHSTTQLCQNTALVDEITGVMTKWGFPTGTLHKPAAKQVAAGDLLSYK